jgi:hypothetical protein
LVISTTNNQSVSLCEFLHYVDQNNLEYFVTDATFFFKEKKIIVFEEMSSQLPPKVYCHFATHVWRKLWTIF